MSRLSDLGDGPLLVQTVLPIVAASDAARLKKKRKKALAAGPGPIYARVWEWLVILTRPDGNKVFANTTGDYAHACAFRDDHLAGGRYEKAWIIGRV